MKKFRSKNILAMAVELVELIEAKKCIKKREKEIKDFFKEKMGESDMATVGNILMTLKEVKKQTLDKEALAKDLGEKEFQKYIETTYHVRFDIKASNNEDLKHEVTLSIR